MNRSLMIRMSRVMGLSLVVGVVMGLIGALFLKALDLVTSIRLDNPWLLMGLPLLGALTAFTYHRYGKNAHQANNLIIDSLHSDTPVPLRMAFLTFFFSIGTHLFGGSAGREGTGVQIGGSLSYALSRRFHLDPRERRLLTMAGISAGFAAVFGTPLSGTFFGMEVAFIGKLSFEAFFPCVISAYTASILTHLLGISHTVYAIQALPTWTMTLGLVLFASSVLFGLTGRVFADASHALKRRLGSIKLPPWQKAFLGGSMIALVMVTLQLTQYAGLSVWLIQAGFNGSVQWFDPILKAVFTILTLGFGYQGGEVTPLFGIGASLGGLIGQLSHLEPSLFAGLGLLAVFGSATNTPVATLLLGIEMFGIQALPFYLIAILISYFVSGHHGIYTAQHIHRSKRHPDHRGKRLRDLHP